VLSKTQKNRIYYRVYRRYKRASKRIGKPFNGIELEGKYFREALEFELRKESQLDELGKEPSNLKSSRNVERRFPRRKSPLDWLANPSDSSKGTHADSCQCSKCMGGFGDFTLIDRIPESPERKAEREAIADEFNEQSEAFATANICPICKSSVCRCGGD